MLNGSRSLLQLLCRLRRIDSSGDRVVLLLAAEVVVEAVDEEVEADDLERRQGVVDRLGRHLARRAEAGARRRCAGRRGARRRRCGGRRVGIDGVGGGARSLDADGHATGDAKRRRGGEPGGRRANVSCGARRQSQIATSLAATPRRRRRSARRGVFLRADDHLLTCSTRALAAGGAEARRERARARSASISRSRGSAFVTSDPIRPRAASATCVDGLLERGLVGLRRHGEAAQLANELERGVADLELGRGRLEVEEGLDVSAHGDRRQGWRRIAAVRCRRQRVRMERDPIALAVEDDRAIAVRADRMRRLHDPAAVARRRRARRRRCRPSTLR